jgi:hypothetical protein
MSTQYIDISWGDVFWFALRVALAALAFRLVWHLVVLRIREAVSEAVSAEIKRLYDDGERR